MNKLMIFGDSIFKGVTYDSLRHRYIICNDNYSEKLLSLGITTENYSKMGATSDKISQIVERRLGEITPETLVLLEFGGNDIDFNWNEVAKEPLEKHEPHTLKNDFADAYKKIIDTVRGTGANIVISNLTPIDHEKYMDWISRCNSRENLMTFLGDTSTLYRYQEYYNHIVEDIASRTGCRLFNIRYSFLMARNYKELICDDGLHPTSEGHKLIGDTIFRFVSDLSA